MARTTETSLMAYRSMIPHMGTIRGKIYRYLKKYPSTCEEVEQALGLRHQTASATMSGLKEDKHIRVMKRDGERVRRRNSSGRLADVYRVRRG